MLRECGFHCEQDYDNKSGDILVFCLLERSMRNVCTAPFGYRLPPELWKAPRKPADIKSRPSLPLTDYPVPHV
ncbi:uncharacterized protein MYCGRDRAFT_102802 [Zymoseptoria tritici IPO323]|uniref:Uncharacterized protein n=1 Tax=Zymoseptoria tritici (strain CBS 115943 / IPO323) TaxID=336722 RepID=F9WWV5_ZYMTI|nr:uncharacterized protein MYCGRDRAFT_102802 [Zymoseptoria tritici IPO323]EGP91580.1 hypothetical protein MYCGRDRAFT_102802 [Zymoseptoria tritici IPO323]